MLSILFVISMVLVSSSVGFHWNGNWAFGCDFVGNDLANARIRGEDCGGRCAATNGCTHFTWTNYGGGTCWMKTNRVSKSDAFRSSNPSAVCGVMDQTSDPGSGFSGSSGAQSGRSTRYWDCCKPSCAWNGKASVSNPVKACSADGFNVVHRDDQSGCNGGNAYTCNNNIPWAINDHLSYGFAAANIKGQSEQDWCCACYELTFTSGPVNGKKMIVHVTNTGGDLGENHFDLQMPGGGVGIFNGCSSQWNAPNQGWGNQYGGVSSEHECNQLPSQIRSGCKWRFQWFKNADNPTFDFVEVTCPTELTSKTGCVRH